jgi:ankyrin repeat protein
VAEYLLSLGAPLDICTAAMLGRTEAVTRLLKVDPANLQATGAHGIPLLAHAALSGNVELTQLLIQRGARAGLSMALSNAVNQGHVDLTRWLLEHATPDVKWKNFQGKTALELALENGDEEIAELLRAFATAS